MTQPDFSRINESIRRLLIQCGDILNSESTEAVTHYLDHDEYEMALEGLLIDLVAGGRFPAGVDWSEVIAIGKDLKLDEEPMFDPHLWEKFVAAVP